jgi:hypothetical protein
LAAACHGDPDPSGPSPAAATPPPQAATAAPVTGPRPTPPSADAVAAAVRAIPPAPKGPPYVPPLSCATDDDCALAPAGCCGCSEGGQNRALSKSALGAWEAARTGRCTEVVCAQGMSDDPTCSASARCVEGTCRLTDASGTPLSPR